ncbi:M14-type cytosolic carboxypeptidase [Sphingomonas sp. SORGH_AS_0879]|uniref:M14 family metallopeptidase n=1 Tax=Sphingomonas sp. SORGH_AS_0879 TaxID=3041790 RepID=UPI002789401D|nr:M14-type cytosolic carboxypeptidase [Sphingomonas sp. SORGH_AS_0879]MDQ1229200.1 murein tripeptide amidase MpaA [Sphingomonas sp. SORGH_AS_0879]
MTLTINASFDGGNIRLVGIEGDRVDLEIIADKDSDFYQWFYFRVGGVKGRMLTFRILNGAGSAFPQGWPGYHVRASTDRRDWRMTPTTYADGVIEWQWTGESDLVWFAYFEPYTMERHHDLVARIAARGVHHEEIGQSLDGQPIDYFRFGDGPKQVWLYARQHPGESMAEWWMEGALDWLTGPAAADLLAKATVHVVPNMNPDGTRRGHLRTNAAGVNLNREWHDPTPERSPEVLCVRNRMDRTGVDFAIDAHGDEAIPANFIAGFEGIPSWTEEHGAKFYEFGRRLAAHTPDFQTQMGYEKSSAGHANLAMSTNQLAERFGAVSVTLEMPFKDHDPNPDAVHGWSGERSAKLGVSCLEVLSGMIGEI